MISSFFLVWLIIHCLVGYGIGEQKDAESDVTAPPGATRASLAQTEPAARAAENPTASPTETPEPTKTPEETPTPTPTPTTTPPPSV